MMKLVQEIVVEGEDLVLNLRDPAADKVLRTRRWVGAAKFVYATKEFSDRGHVYVLAVPVSAHLELDEADLIDEVVR